ncbi:exonuclease domain-containing protein (plasmid) [Pseudoalteromonas sp. T1lg65]|uniref:exonuclease domain-containing protein n=1 Tax=Pseudoalteromonas sp. T1lg65 TaxID=2077101 RepID=UPI003F7A93DF
MKKVLPQKYYLQHFDELSDFLLDVCNDLLSEEQSNLLFKINQLEENEKCLLVRFLTRKTPFLHYSQLHYSEIADIPKALTALCEKHMLRSLSKQDLSTVLDCMTKAQLQTLIEQAGLTLEVKKSASKSQWQQAVAAVLRDMNWVTLAAFQGYYTTTLNDDFCYFLFLFFGSIDKTFSQFSMRDLGVMATRGDSIQAAHFEDIDEAQSCYFYASSIKQLVHADEQTLRDVISAFTNNQFTAAKGYQAQLLRDKYTYLLAQAAKSIAPDLTEAVLKLSTHPKSQEQYLRLLYERGEHQQVIERLNAIMAEPQDEALLVFAEDFYQRKFQGQKTSVLTNWLKSAGAPLAIDEAYRGMPERGVIEHYQRNNVQAWHVENTLWLNLFVLTFWNELYYHPRHPIANGFSKTPKLLKDNRFYQLAKEEINSRLDGLSTNLALYKWVVAQATRYYQQPSRLINWQSNFLQPLEALIIHSELAWLKGVLIEMSKNFTQFNSGFPDLLVLERNNHLRFLEVKAPGDSLRRNQLVTIRRLQQVGFKVDIQPVEWQINPQQSYVVIDIETTGGNKDYDRITEIGIVKVVNGKVTDTWHSLINPEKRIPSRISQLTGITNEMVATAPTFAEVQEQVMGFCRDSIFVAHNVNFDFGFMRSAFARCDVSFDLAKLCTVSLARRYLPKQPSYSLKSLCDYLNIELKNHHRALDDAQAAAEIFMIIQPKRLMEQFSGS